VTSAGHDAIVVGSGPNGLAAAITVAEAGRSVLVLEARETIGGGCRSAELTLPGFVHDVCSAVHPLVAGSPFFRTVPLSALGADLVQPSAPLAHPLDDVSAVVVERSEAATAAGLGPDAGAYRRLMEPLVRDAKPILEGLLGPPRRPPRHPLVLARFAVHGLRSATGLGRGLDGERARARSWPACRRTRCCRSTRPCPSCGWPLESDGSCLYCDELAGARAAAGAGDGAGADS
jgi:phytoene dehydrogenase-like protein